MRYGWTDDEDEFLAECEEQVEHGECNLSATDLGYLLEIIDRLKKEQRNAG
jgi:hypothetical protein